ncbi:MAG: hypothetical protein CMJ72_09980 [Planctomycetaceae bacterium]|nr:hypothetical protein [Planctomycetaceae bacterium]HCK41817.1 hypothetical protein [Planctomycetaceae bacterium]
MDFLNQALGQIKELMQSMTPAARVTALLLLGVIVVSMGYLVQHHSASPDEYLFNGEFLPGRDVDRAEAAIAQARLTGYQRVGNRIKVPQGQKAEYLAAVADAGALPPNFHSLLEQALDLGPFTDRVTKQERLKAAREQQLSMIIRSMDGIEEAQVIFDRRDPKGLGRAGDATASVNVRPTPGAALDPRQAKMIKMAVASAIAGLRMDQVTVTNLSDDSMFSSGTITGDSFDNEYYQQRIAFEQLMKTKVENLLRNVPGVLVQVTAELDDTIERTTRTVTPEGDPAVLRSVSENQDKETSEVVDGGRPGPVINGPSGAKEENAAQVTVKDKDTNTIEQSENMIGQKDETLRSAALVPTDVRVAIAVPENYVIDIWREKERKLGNDPGEGFPDETARNSIELGINQKITEVVAPLLPKILARDSQSKVIVQFLDSLAPQEIAEPSMANQILVWAGKYFNTMTMAVVALVSLMMLRSMVKSILHAEPTASLANHTFSLDENESSASDSTPNENRNPENDGRPRLRLKKGSNLKDDLVEIVQEDPDAAAAILRTWIGNAG